MRDLFERESGVLDHATEYLESIQETEFCHREEYTKLLHEYARILKLVRRLTKMNDKKTVELIDDKISLMNKVHYDALTGIFNRRYFEEETEKVALECEHTCRSLGMLMIDVDFFKQYNDTYGHSAGDECLQIIARVLKESMDTKEGYVVRYGGEEFTAVLPGADKKAVSQLAEKMLQNMRKQNVKHEKNAEKGYVTISIGGISRKRIFANQIDAYVRGADAALYRSKQTGRDKFTLQLVEEESGRIFA